MEEFGSIFDFAIAGYGIYFIYLSLSAKIKGEVFRVKELLPATCTMDKCKDPDAFTAYMIPRVLLFGVLLFLFGAASFLGLFGSYMLIACIAFVVFLVVFYFVVLKRAAKLFW